MPPVVQESTYIVASLFNKSFAMSRDFFCFSGYTNLSKNSILQRHYFRNGFQQEKHPIKLYILLLIKAIGEQDQNTAFLF